ncbi:MAG: hypothetical protein AABX64_00020 [Nanoarchaeota archaeon]
MRLIRQKGREYEGKEYFKYILVVPNKVIKKLGWKGGEDLEANIKEKKLIVKKD